MKRVAAVAALVWLAVLGRPGAIAAHTTSTGLATLSVSGPTLSYRLTILPDELSVEAARLLTSAADGDQASVERIALELRRRVTVRAGDSPVPPGPRAHPGLSSRRRPGDSRADNPVPGAARPARDPR